MTNTDKQTTEYLEPAPDGSISAELIVAPVSQQAKGKRKAKLQKILRREFRKYKFYYSGEVAVHITWYGREDRRYETIDDPDVDNIVKPILDALSGIEGVMFDDCQVQHVSSTWIDTEGIDQLEIRIENPMKTFIPKQNIVFIKYSPNRCYPLSVDKNMTKDSILNLLASIESALIKRDKIQKEKGYMEAKAVMPIQTLFHLSRINSFPVVEYDNISSYLDKLFAK